MSALGLVESRNIADGIMLADMMVKQAAVKLLLARTICSGRFMIHLAGELEAIKAAMGVACYSPYKLAGHFIISRVSAQVIEALARPAGVSENDAVAVIECRTATSGIVAADAAVKAASVKLAKLVTGQGIMGKSYFIIGGDVSSVEAGTNAARIIAEKNLVSVAVIPSPDKAVLNAITRVVR